MNIAGLDKAEVLAALYNGARQQGMGFIDARGRETMSVELARDELRKNERMYFDYLYGRVLKISLLGDELSTALYDRDNGVGAAWNAISQLHGVRGPDVSDGHDGEGFVGRCERHGCHGGSACTESAEAQGVEGNVHVG